MFEKTKLLLKAFNTDPNEQFELLFETLKSESKLNRDGYHVLVKFHITHDDLIVHKAVNPVHLEMSPIEHVREMIQDHLYDNGPLGQGDFEILEIDNA